jgi:hypothetical protein
MNRTGKTYMSKRHESGDLGQPFRPINGSVITVLESLSWNHDIGDNANFSHQCLVLSCPMDTTQIGKTVRLDERKWSRDGKVISSWDVDEKYVEI